MAHSLSAKKRIRQNDKCRALNRWRKRTYREAIKDFQELILHGTVEQCEAKLTEIYKILDQAASTPAMHKKTASRYKGRLATKLNKRKAAA
ncbi:30S ribosomal protein S20 [Planctomycetota bacterium]|nr:30S ribosomal protein S20 [Planctomycetota bacterium]